MIQLSESIRSESVRRARIHSEGVKMSSWQIFRRLTDYWGAIENPVFAREIQRAPLWQRYASRAAQSSGLTVALGGVLCYLSLLIAYYAETVLVLFVPLALGWTLLISLTLAPIVVREREENTWHTLRTTPLEIDAIVLGKAAGALWWLRYLLRGVMGLTVLGAVGVGIGSLIFVSFASAPLSRLPVPVVCGLTLALPLVSSVLFLVDRGQQAVLSALAALAVSARSRTVRLAAPMAAVVALTATLLDASLGLLVLTQFGQLTAPLHETGLMLILFGPAVMYLAELPFWGALLAALSTMLLREALVWIGWRWMLRAARLP